MNGVDMKIKLITNNVIISLEAGCLTVQVKWFARSTVVSARRRVRAACKLAGVALRGDGVVGGRVQDPGVPFPPSYKKFVIYEYIEDDHV